MPSQARLDTPGTLHHVIIRGIEKVKIVDDQNDQQNFFDRMGDLSKQTQTYIYAWALMSNHSHILLRSGLKGISQAEVARHLGVSTSAISLLLWRANIIDK